MATSPTPQPKNLPPSTPVAAASRPPPDNTDEQKRSARMAVRQQRHVAALKDPASFNPDEPEQTVSVIVNNGTHGGYRAIGQFFPNGLTQGVEVTEGELAELKAEPQDIIRVVDAAEVASLGGKGSSGSSAPQLSADEQKVLSDFRSSGQDAATYLAQPQPTGTGTTPASGSSAASSKASTDSDDASGNTSKRK